MTNGGNLSLYAASLNCTSLEARGTGTTNTGNIKLYYLPTVDANSMLVTNGGSVAIWAPATNLPGTNYATLVTVQGNLTIGSNSWVYPWAGNRTTDTARTIYMRAANIAIAAGGGIDADGKGYARAWGPGKGANGPGSSRSGGGGHGGAGAASDYGVAGGITNDNALMPIDAGSGGGNQGLVILNSDGVDIGGGEGGGAVRLEATGTVNLDGTITADGIASGPSLPTMAFGGGGAGGTIYVKCNKFAGAATGRMTAEGRSGAGNGINDTGGGRIAVWRVVHTYNGMPSVTDRTNSVDSIVTFAWSTAGGTGTVEWVDVPPPPPSGTVFILE